MSSEHQDKEDFDGWFRLDDTIFNTVTAIAWYKESILLRHKNGSITRLVGVPKSSWLRRRDTVEDNIWVGGLKCHITHLMVECKEKITKGNKPGETDMPKTPNKLTIGCLNCGGSRELHTIRTTEPNHIFIVCERCEEEAEAYVNKCVNCEKHTLFIPDCRDGEVKEVCCDCSQSFEESYN